MSFFENALIACMSVSLVFQRKADSSSRISLLFSKTAAALYSLGGEAREIRCGPRKLEVKRFEPCFFQEAKMQIETAKYKNVNPDE